MFLRCAKENNKKYDCKNNTYRISYSCIINNCAFCRFGIDQTAKTFRCKDEICNLETALIKVAGTAVIQKFFFSLTRYMDAAQRTIIASVWFVQLK